MGEFMDKWLPEMKNQQELKSLNSLEYQSKLVQRTCLDCKTEFSAVVSYYPRGFVYDRGDRCPSCKLIRAREFDVAEKGKITEETNSRRERWRNTCGIPTKYMAKGFQHFNQDWQPRAFEQVEDYAHEFPITDPKGYKSLVLFSTRSWGTGKTHLACAVAHHILSRWNGETGLCPVRFISEPTLFKSIKDTYSFSPLQRETQDSESDIINSLIRVPLLILDDLGKEDVADLRFVQRTLFAIFDGRYNAELPVLVTANLDDAGLRAHMGGASDNEASFSRLLEMCRGRFIRVDGASYRDKLAGEK